MKSYKERTRAVLEKVEKHNKTDGYTAENGGYTLSIKRRNNVIIWSAVAAIFLALIVTFNLVLFLPYKLPPISDYEGSDYYGLISVLNGITYRNQYENNFDKWSQEIGWGANKGDTAVPPTAEAPGVNGPNGNFDVAGDASNSITAKPDSSGNGSYEEVTNNQVKAVTEADILKRSTNYAFYLSLNPSLTDNGGITLLTYRLNGKDTSLTSSYKLNNEKGTFFYSDTCEGYLSSDCNTVTVISNCYDTNEKTMYACVINLDVSNPENVKESGRIYFTGSYISSRLTNDTLLLFTNYNVKYNPDFSNEADFLPQSGTLDNLKSIYPKDIIYPEDATSARYTVVCALDGKSLEINSNYAFLSFSQSVYVSENNVYLTRAYSRERGKDEESWYNNYTELTCISYADGTLTPVNKAEVPGTVLNQYSMDEYDGNLRVVTGYSVAEYEEANGSKHKTYKGAGLFCIDLESFALRASLKNFCPDGENVYSVRFDGTTAYVCTALVRIIATDPVFAIDLSDLDNITFKDTGTIPGYSLSLMKFRDDALLGIGYGEDMSNLKVELYTQTGNVVESVASFEKRCSFSPLFKAYFINPENGLVGLNVFYYDENRKRVNEFILLLYDGYSLMQVGSVKYENYVSTNYTRAFLADGYIYVFADNEISVIDWNA